MRVILLIPFISFFSFCQAEDYIVEFQAKVKNLIEYNISKTKKV